jgi:hypothetical protein
LALGSNWKSVLGQREEDHPGLYQVYINVQHIIGIMNQELSRTFRELKDMFRGLYPHSDQMLV